MNLFTYNNVAPARFFAILIAVSMILSALPVHFFVANAERPSTFTYDPDVAICHANEGIKVFTNQTVNASSIVKDKGHEGHDTKGLDDKGDIIPAFDYNDGSGTTTYPGKNLTTVYGSSTGADVYNDGLCNGGPLAPTEATVTVCKIDEGKNLLSGWEVSIDNDETEPLGGTTAPQDADYPGCVTLEDVPYGEYTLDEVLKEGWENVSGKGETVIVNEETETFTLINREILQQPRVCTYGFDSDNLLLNGSFEEPVIQGSWSISSITDWVITKVSDNSPTSGELWRGLGIGPSDGEQNVELAANEATQISQNVVTIPGATYELRFDFAARGTNVADNNVDATIDGNTIVNANTGNTQWVEYSAQFVADDASTDVALRDVGTDNGTGSLVDNAVLCLVTEPEPDPWCSYEGQVTEYTADVDAKTNAGNPVVAARRDITAVETIAPYQNIGGTEGNDWNVNPLDFFTLGIEGYLVYEFTDAVAFDQAGPDIAVYEITGGTGAQTDEKVEVSVSKDGITFVSLGEFTGDAEIDISPAGLDYVKFVRLDDKSSGIQGNNGDGYDVDAIVILNGSCGEEPLECTVTIVSDDTATVVEKDGAFAKLLSFIHPAWTADIPGASWIWGDDPVVNPSVEETQTFVNQFGWAGTVDSATLYVASDNSHKADLNGSPAGEATEEQNFRITDQDQYDVTGLIEQGNNDLSIAVKNWAGNANPASNPAGALYKLEITTTDDVVCEIPYDNGMDYAPYCGDGIVGGEGQEWEQCDGSYIGGGEGQTQGGVCNSQCQYVEQNQCTDLTLAKIDMENVSNTGNGDMTDDVYLGQGALPIPNNVWFRVFENDVYDNDADLASYEDVPGLAVQRLDGSLRTVMHGTATGKDVEHIDGTIDFWSWDDSVDATLITSDNSTDTPNSNRLEKPFNGNQGNAGDDEVEISGGDVFFWLTTTTADDGFYTDYSEPVECKIEPKCLIDGYKYDHTGSPLSGWTIGLAETMSDHMYDVPYVLDPSIFGTDVTDDNGYYCLNIEKKPENDLIQTAVVPPVYDEYAYTHLVFEEMQDGWMNIKVEIDGEGATPQSDSFFDVFVEVNLDEHPQVDFYNKQEDQLTCEPEVNLIANGGFETPAVVHQAGWNIFAEGTAGLAWLIDWVNPNGDATDPASLELHGGVNGWLPSEGSQYAELDGDYEGPDGGSGEPASTEISQVIDTIPGEEYTLSWDFSPRPDTFGSENDLLVSVEGAPVGSNSAAGAAQTSWTSDSYTFTATGTETTVAFADDGVSNSIGTFVDNVALTCNPEPEGYNYCGDGFENQEWEQCDGTEGCTDYCTFENQCTDLRLVKITLEQSRSVSFDDTVYLGDAMNPIPNGTWFHFDEIGDTEAQFIANDAQGLGVERDQAGGTLNLAFVGGNDSKDLDFAIGSIETLGIDLGSAVRSLVPGYELENNLPAFVDIFEKDGNNLDFDMRADTGNDGATVEIGSLEEPYNCPVVFKIQGYVWHDDNENSIWDGFSGGGEQLLVEVTEDPQAGWTVWITNGEDTFSTTTDENGYYYFDVPEGTWTITETVQTGWGRITQESHVVTVPEVVAQVSQTSIFAAVVNYFMPTVHAQSIPEDVYGDYNFGNNELEIITTTSGGGGGGGGRRVSRATVEDDDTPTPQVLGEQVSIVPAGAPNAGAGGASPLNIVFTTLVPLACVGRKLKTDV